jgi:hypothetical protein
VLLTSRNRNAPLSGRAQNWRSSKRGPHQLPANTSADPVTRDSLFVSVLLGALISVAISWGQLGEVWATGAFFDTDDATRLVQVRDWMAGQAWYDLRMHRLGFPGAEPMHWTRIVDVPVAFLIKASSLFLDPVMSERAARIAFPFLLSVGVIGVSALIAIELVGGASVMIACLTTSFAGLSLLQFQPGRIDHHAPQILLLMTSGLFALRAICGKQQRRNGFLSAACLAAMLAISLENLPEACIMGACFAALWAVQGKARSEGLNGFGWGLMSATPLFYVLTMSPARWFSVACDAQSFMHVTLMTAAGALCVCLTMLGRSAATPRTRWLWIAATGLALAVLMRTGFPQCGLDPYSDVDPLVRRDWLDKVKEAYSVAQAWSVGLQGFVLINYIPVLTGLAGVLVAIRRSEGEARLRWLVWFALSLVALSVAVFRIGTVQTAQVITSMGAVYVLSLVSERWRALRIPGAFALSVVALALVVPADRPTSADAQSAQCTRPQDATGLTLLPEGRVLASIDEGAYLLAFTQHAIVAAPYHRNNDGNRLEAQAFALPPEDALQLLKSRQVDYIAICGAERRDSPLIAALLAGLPGATKLEVSGNYQAWRIER